MVLDVDERGAHELGLAGLEDLLTETLPHLTQAHLRRMAERTVLQVNLRLLDLVVLLALQERLGVRTFGLVGAAHATALQRWKRTYLYTNSSALRVSEYYTTTSERG